MISLGFTAGGSWSYRSVGELAVETGGHFLWSADASAPVRSGRTKGRVGILSPY